jgi:hypothetical protein
MDKHTPIEVEIPEQLRKALRSVQFTITRVVLHRDDEDRATYYVDATFNNVRSVEMNDAFAVHFMLNNYGFYAVSCEINPTHRLIVVLSALTPRWKIV